MERRNGTRITGDRVKVLFTYLYVLIVYGRASENVAYPDYQPKTEDRLAGRRRCSRVNKTHANMTRDAKSEIATACVSIAGKKRSSLKPRLEINSQHLATGRGCPTGTARSKLETIRKRSASEDQVTRVLPLSLADARSSLLLVTRYSLLATRCYTTTGTTLLPPPSRRSFFLSSLLLTVLRYSFRSRRVASASLIGSLVGPFVR
mgnify:CR=1 FL=1